MPNAAEDGKGVSRVWHPVYKEGYGQCQQQKSLLHRLMAIAKAWYLMAVYF